MEDLVMYNDDYFEKDYLGKIMNYLKELGFAIEEPGYGTYTKIIDEAIYNITLVGEDLCKLKPFVEELRDPYSGFYDLVSMVERQDIDDIHKSLQSLVDHIDYKNANEKLYEELFCRIYKDIDYGEFALVIAAHILGKTQIDSYINEEKPMIRHLSKKDE